MIISNKSLYYKEINRLEQYEDDGYQDEDFKHGFNDQNLIYESLKNLDISNSIMQAQQIMLSKFYNNHVFISALNIIQTNMKLISNILEQSQKIYGVWLCQQGQWKLIITDYHIPCYQENQQIKPATIQSEYQWPILIEKAIVKIIGNEYAIFQNNLLNNSIDSYLHLLTGGIIRNAYFINYQEFVDALYNKDDIYYIQRFEEDKNLYCVFESVQDQKSIKLKAVNSQSILKQGQNREKSYFYLSWEQVRKEINSSNVFVLRVNQNYQIRTFPLDKPTTIQYRYLENTFIFKYQVKEQSNHIFTVCQYDQIFMHNSRKEEIKYAMLRIMLFRINGQRYELLDGQYKSQKQLSIQQLLQQGEYILYIQAQFFNIINQIGLPKEVTDLNLQIKSLVEPGTLELQDRDIEKYLIYSIACQRANQSNTKVVRDQPKIQRTHGDIHGLFYFAYKNLSETNLTEVIDCSQCTNLVDAKSQMYLNSFSNEIKPKEFKVQVFSYDPLVMETSNSVVYQYAFGIKTQIGEGIANFQFLTGTKPENLQQALKMEKQNKIDDNVCFYIKQHDYGVAILFENTSDMKSELELKLAAENLSYQPYTKNLDLRADNTLLAHLNGQTHSIVLFKIIDVSRTYTFEFEIKNKQVI